MEKKAKIFVAGGDKLIGSSLLRVLRNQEYQNVFDASLEPCLSNSGEVEAFFRRGTPEYVFLTAGKSGGITANLKYPAEFMLDNLLIECLVIDAAYRYGVKKLLYLASSCCYPRDCPSPMHENQLLTGPLEPTNEPYALAKIAGIKLVQSYRNQYGVNFICGIPANCFGPGDDFSKDNSHVIGALIRRMDEAKKQRWNEVAIWGTGKPRREFIYVDDLADACIFIMENYEESEPINLGPGGDISIAELAQRVRKVTDFRGELVFDASKPDGMPVKLLDTTKIRDLGWKSKVPFQRALELTYSWFLGQEKAAS
jgi:GDP-L-fucose synthase